MAAICLASYATAEPAGLRQIEIAMPHHGVVANATMWYPNGGGGARTVFAENPVFRGVDAALSAEVADGSHPLVLFSHGMGGTARAQAWFASGLAARGAVVLSVDHPRSSWGDYDMTEGVRHWTRAADLSVALDALLADPEVGPRIDTSRIMAAGFSYGGWTALSLGGARGNHAGLVEACSTFVETMAACDMLLSEAVDMQGLDPDRWNADYADPRITHVAAIDPGFVWGLEAADMARVVPNVLMIGFGGPEDRMSATDFDASGLLDLLPGATILRIDPGFHFTAMPLCKPGAAEILRAENDDPVCTDPPGTDRAAAHASVIAAIARELGL
jgi:predicted dienelactone hydrolase